MDLTVIKSKTQHLRRMVLDLVFHAGTGHIGGDFSVMDILAALYYREMNVSPDNVDDPDRDRFVLSKGHSVEALYAILADIGFIEQTNLMETYSSCGSMFIGHPNNKIRGIEMNTGSLGHGLPVAVGMALAGKIDQAPYRVYAVLGDGELAEGSIYEALSAAAHYKLNNLIALIDLNGLQISGSTKEVMDHKDLHSKLQTFGWNVVEVLDGNDVFELCDAIEHAKENTNAPTVIIAHTVKGKGVSFMENKANWHHKIPSQQEYDAACLELMGGNQ